MLITSVPNRNKFSLKNFVFFENQKLINFIALHARHYFSLNLKVPSC